MTRSQWTVALVFGCSIVLIGAAWRLYSEGFTWDVAAIALMAILFLVGQTGHNKRVSQRVGLWP
jgi:hypothetical protein